MIGNQLAEVLMPNPVIVNACKTARGSRVSEGLIIPVPSNRQSENDYELHGSIKRTTCERRKFLPDAAFLLQGLVEQDIFGCYILYLHSTETLGSAAMIQLVA